MHSRRNSRLLWLALPLALALAGCGSSDNGGAVQQSSVRVLNTGTASETVTVGSTTLASALGVGRFSPSTGYTALPAGAFSPSGTGFANLQFTTAPSISAGGAYTLVSSGVPGQAGATAPSFLLIPSYNQSVYGAIGTGNVAVRVVNLAPGAAGTGTSVGLYTTNAGVPNQALAAALGNVGYGYTSAANAFVQVPVAQMTNLALVDPTSPGTALTVPAGNFATFSTFTAGQAYTLYVFGGFGSQTPGAVWVSDTVGTWTAP